ncbi:MAG: cytochrome P450 [bacterium]
MKAYLHDVLVNVAAHPLGWPLARLARRTGRVMRIPRFGLVVSDAAFAHDVLVNDDDFRKMGEGTISETLTEFIGPSALSNMDGEAHRRLRSRLVDVTSPAQARLLLAACDVSLAQLVADLNDGKTVDLVRWMRVMSGRLTFDMLGITPPAGAEEQQCIELVMLGEQIASGFDLRTPSRSRVERAKAQCDRLAAYARQGYDSPTSPANSFVRRVRDLGFTFEEAKGVISIIFLAGTLTTTAALPRIVALLADSNSLGRLKRDKGTIATALAEGLRYTAPVLATMRIAHRTVELRAHRIREGERIVILTYNLARDPRLFTKPDRFDAFRVHDARARNLWFGAGAHFCLGFAVAQLQLRMVMDALLAADGDLEIVRRRVSRNVIVPAYAQLDLRLARTRK